MSDVPADYRDRLDIREQIARIDWAREETLRFAAEQNTRPRQRSWDATVCSPHGLRSLA
jgi:hypothetical protein